MNLHLSQSHACVLVVGENYCIIISIRHDHSKRWSFALIAQSSEALHDALYRMSFCRNSPGVSVILSLETTWPAL